MSLHQDEEIGWDDDVLQTEGFPVLEEFLATWQKPAKEFYGYFNYDFSKEV